MRQRLGGVDGATVMLARTTTRGFATKAAVRTAAMPHAPQPGMVYEDINDKARKRYYLCLSTNLAFTANLMASFWFPADALIQSLSVGGSLGGLCLFVINHVVARHELARITLIDDSRVKLTTYTVTGRFRDLVVKVDDLTAKPTQLASKTVDLVPIKIAGHTFHYLLSKRGSFFSASAFRFIFKAPLDVVLLSTLK
ncbi:unnamed protein product (mitochondrion) [Plasmodiophora brassicae]|uniref:Transmembrane protein 186 n=1 Tax=Plasmodiophora brassicae TaxID=37360 RepID=A0A3P3Y7U0_PLABS|nr:unnamed protein product [Plasmodiophora brassicae]